MLPGLDTAQGALAVRLMTRAAVVDFLNRQPLTVNR
jgi:hypothetical protein